MIIVAFGESMCNACRLMEDLRRNEMAKLTHIETKLVSPQQIVSFPIEPLQAKYCIEIHCAVGRYGKYISGYVQRKVLSFFSKIKTCI